MRRRAVALLAGLAFALVTAYPTAGSTPRSIAPDTVFWAGPPNPGAVRQIRDLKRNGKTAAAARLQAMRWTNGPTDPVRGVHDPSAGGWFRAQAREFADLAVPSFP